MNPGLITYLTQVKAKSVRSQKQVWYAIRQDVKDAQQENRTALVHKN